MGRPDLGRLFSHTLLQIPLIGPVLGDQNLTLHGPLDLRRHQLEIEGLAQVVDGTGAHRFQHGVKITHGRRHDDSRVGVVLTQPSQDLQTTDLGHDDVEGDQVEGAVGEELLDLCKSIGIGNIVAILAQPGRHQFADGFLVIDDEDGALRIRAHTVSPC